MSGLIPPQRIARAYLSEAGPLTLHEGREYTETLGKLVRAAGPKITCDYCGWVADAGAVEVHTKKYMVRDEAVLDKNGKPYQREVGLPGGGLFAVHHLDHDHGNYDPDNLALYCEPCHHAHHVAVPGLAISGWILLVSGIPQDEIIHIWRAVVAVGGSKTSSGVDPKWYSVALQQYGYMAIKAALGHDTQRVQLPLSPKVAALTPEHLRHWVAYAKPESVDRFNELVPDLRFLPALDSCSFYQTFCTDAEEKLAVTVKDPSIPEPEPASPSALPIL